MTQTYSKALLRAAEAQWTREGKTPINRAREFKILGQCLRTAFENYDSANVDALSDIEVDLERALKAVRALMMAATRE